MNLSSIYTPLNVKRSVKNLPRTNSIVLDHDMSEDPISEFSRIEVSGSRLRSMGQTDAEKQDARSYRHRRSCGSGSRDNDLRHWSPQLALRRDNRHNSQLHHRRQHQRVQRQQVSPRTMASHDRTSM